MVPGFELFKGDRIKSAKCLYKLLQTAIPTLPYVGSVSITVR